MLLIANQLRQLDVQLINHQLAWILRSSEGLNKNDKFNDFYDIEDAEYNFWNSIEPNNKGNKLDDTLKELLATANSGKGVDD